MADASRAHLELAAWQQRLLDEERQLNERLCALEKVLSGATKITLSQTDRDDLVRQHAYMAGYHTILHRRIEKLLPSLTRGV